MLTDEQKAELQAEIDRKNTMDLKAIEESLVKHHDTLEAAIVEAKKEMTEMNGVLRDETKGQFDKLIEQYTTIAEQIKEAEQKLYGKDMDDNSVESFGAQFIKTDSFKALVDGSNVKARMELKTAIINATGASQPLVQAERVPGIIHAPERILTVRDMLPVATTASNLIEFPKENVFTNNAGPQIGESPEVYENVAKPESGITFTLSSEAVRTLAHWIPASRQVLDDSTMLAGYINARLMYGLKLKEETQLLLGSGVNGELNGIYTQATAYTVQSPNLTNELDIIRESIKQAHVSEYLPTAIVLNPLDWYDIDVKKVGSSDDRYVVGNPREMTAPRLWGLPVVVTNSIAANTFLVGAFDIGAQIWDRQASAIEVSRENSDNFVKNMVTILAEERLALTVYRAAAFIKGSL